MSPRKNKKWSIADVDLSDKGIEKRFGIPVDDKTKETVIEPLKDSIEALHPDAGGTKLRETLEEVKRKPGRPTNAERAERAKLAKLTGVPAPTIKLNKKLVPMMPEKFRRRAQGLAPLGMDEAERMLKDRSLKPADRIAIIKEVNDRAYGKAAQSVDVIYQGMTNAELELRRQELIERIGSNRTGTANQGCDTIEGQFREDTGGDRPPDEPAAEGILKLCGSADAQ